VCADRTGVSRAPRASFRRLRGFQRDGRVPHRPYRAASLALTPRSRSRSVPRFPAGDLRTCFDPHESGSALSNSASWRVQVQSPCPSDLRPGTFAIAESYRFSCVCAAHRACEDPPGWGESRAKAVPSCAAYFIVHESLLARVLRVVENIRASCGFPPICG